MAKLTLAWNDEQTDFAISEELIGKLEQLLRIAGKQESIAEGEVALTFVNDERIRELNRDYRGLDKSTDVLSFAITELGEDEPEIRYDGEYEVEEIEVSGDGDGEDDVIGEDGEPVETLLGDILISVPTAIRQAEEYGHSVERELGFLFVHGFLHLIGYDHDTEADEKDMFAKQEQILSEAGLTR